MDTFCNETTSRSPLADAYYEVPGILDEITFSPGCEIAYYVRNGDQMIRSELSYG